MESREFRRIFLDLIKELDCKKSEVPEKLGIDYGIYKKIVDFGRIPKPVVLMRIADYFRVSVESLLGRSKEEFEKSENPKTFWQRYTELKTERGLTDYAVAQYLHVSTSYPANWKKFGYVPSLENLMILADLFQVSLDYLLGRTDQKNYGRV